MVTAQALSPERSEPDYAFDFCGGHLAVDFTNTVGNRGSDPEEHFTTYGDVVAWAESREVIDRAKAARLRRTVSADPDGARREFRRAIELREALYRVFASAARGRKPAPPHLEALNRFVSEVYEGATLAAEGNGFALALPAGEGLDAVLYPVIKTAVDLLTTSALARIRLCADESCAWLFVDATRSGTRRWCDMKVCGNRNKVRRFRDSP